jgi:hypothetical protein
VADSTSLAYDSLLSTTLYNYASTLENNVFNARPFLNWLKRKGNIKTYDGGARVVVPILTGTNSTSGFYSMYDTISTTPQDGITAAEFLWRQAAASVAIAGLEEAQNSGKQAVLDLLQAKVMQAEESLANTLSNSVFALTTPTNAYTGIGNITDATAICGGLDPSLHTTWAGYVSNSATPLTISDLSAGWDGVAQGGSDTPDFIITTQVLWEKYESLLQPQLRYSDPATADAGFVNLLYRGAPVVWDVACAQATTGFTYDVTPLYFLNSKHVWIAAMAGKWFTNTPFQRPVNADARYAQILCYGNLVTNCRRRLGKLTARTA